MKSHFQFSNKERNGIFLLLLIIVLIQSYLWFSEHTPKELLPENKELELFRNEVDSLKKVKLEAQTPSLYPFNPNFISDYKGYTLGMSTTEIDRLHQYRESGQWINSAQQFQDVTRISDSLLNVISPFFKFPEWVTNSAQREKGNKTNFKSNSNPKTYAEKKDLNTATANQLQRIYGIGAKLSERIIAFRKTFGNGFHDDVELTEVYGLNDEVIKRITDEFTVKSPRPIIKIDLNKATRDELVQIKYIDYEIANNIIEERTLRDGFKNFEELTKVEDFPVNKLEIIKLYLHL